MSSNKQKKKNKNLACNRKEAETVKQVESDEEAVLLENWFPELLNLMISVTSIPSCYESKKFFCLLI